MFPGWEVEEDEDRVAFFASEDGVGALQISTYWNHERSVTVEEVHDFASDEFGGKEVLEQVSCGDFSGLHITREVEQTHWRKWFLCAGSLMLFVTYNSSVGDRNKENATVDAVLNTLKLKDAS